MRLLGPQRCFRHSQDSWRGRLRLKHSPPQFSTHGHFKPVRKPVGQQGLQGEWLHHSLSPGLQTSAKASFSLCQGVKRKSYGQFQNLHEAFSIPESTEFHLATGTTLWIRYLKVLKTEPQE